MAGTWRYVASRSREEATGEIVWEVRELYPTDDGGFGYTQNAIAARGESLEALRTDLTHVLADLELPVLDLTTDPPRLISHEELLTEEDQ